MTTLYSRSCTVSGLSLALPADSCVRGTKSEEKLRNFTRTMYCAARARASEPEPQRLRPRTTCMNANCTRRDATTLALMAARLPDRSRPATGSVELGGVVYSRCKHRRLTPCTLTREFHLGHQGKYLCSDGLPAIVFSPFKSVFDPETVRYVARIRRLAV